MQKEYYLTSGNWEQKINYWTRDLEIIRNHEKDQVNWDQIGLLVLDMQNIFLSPQSHAYIPSSRPILPNLIKTIEFFLAKGCPIWMTQHTNPPNSSNLMNWWWKDPIKPNSDNAQIHPDLAKFLPYSTLLQKQHYSAFFHTELKKQLEAKGINQLLITGVMTHLCCESTARDAFMHGFQIFLGMDLTASYTEDLHLGALRSITHGFGECISFKDLQISSNYDSESGLSMRKTQPNNKSLDKTIHTVIIVGAGPAGLSAAIQLQRNNIEPLILSQEIGGLIQNAHQIENYLGFPNGISGQQFQQKMVQQAKSQHLNIVFDKVTKIENQKENKGKDEEKELFLIETLTTKYFAKNVILASGTIPKQLEISGEKQAFEIGKLHYEPSSWFKDGNIPYKQTIAIIGSGDIAYDYALNLSSYGNSIIILQRSYSSRALALLQKRVQKAEHISIRHFEVIKIEIDHQNQKLKLFDSQELLIVDEVIVAIGRKPNFGFLSEELKQRMITQDKFDPTSIISIGDLTNGHFRQISIASGTGLHAAMQFLENQK